MTVWPLTEWVSQWELWVALNKAEVIKMFSVHQASLKWRSSRCKDAVVANHRVANTRPQASPIVQLLIKNTTRVNSKKDQCHTAAPRFLSRSLATNSRVTTKDRQRDTGLSVSSVRCILNVQRSPCPNSQGEHPHWPRSTRKEIWCSDSWEVHKRNTRWREGRMKSIRQVPCGRELETIGSDYYWRSSWNKLHVTLITWDVGTLLVLIYIICI